MQKRSKKSKRAPFRVPVLDTWVTLNKATGQGYVMLPDVERGGCNVRHYVGRLLDDGGAVVGATVERAARLVAEQRAGAVVVDAPGQLTVAAVLAAFVAAQKVHASTWELAHFDGAFAPVRTLYGPVPALEFGPKALQAVRERMIASGRLNRATLNDRVRRIVAAFRWATAQELVPASVHQALACVGGTRRGRVAGLRESRKVKAVPDAHVDAVLPFVSAQVRAIVELMRLSGARCVEVVQLRPADVDTAREPWVFTPRKHKTEHHDKTRMIAFGPKARAILGPWLLRPADRFCFVPAEAEEARLQAKNAARVTPAGVGNERGTNRVAEPLKKPGERYCTNAVRRAIERACKKGGGSRAGRAGVDAAPAFATRPERK